MGGDTHCNGIHTNQHCSILRTVLIVGDNFVRYIRTTMRLDYQQDCMDSLQNFEKDQDKSNSRAIALLAAHRLKTHEYTLVVSARSQLGTQPTTHFPRVFRNGTCLNSHLSGRSD